MSKRLSKRQLREQQELATLGNSSGGTTNTLSSPAETAEEPRTEDKEGENGDDGDDSRAGGGDAGGLFAQLGNTEDAGQSSDEEDAAQDDAEAKPFNSGTKNKKKKKKKKAALTADDEGQGHAGAEIKPNLGSPAPKKSRTSSTRESKGTKDVSSMSMDELSALLASQSQVDRDTILSREADVPELRKSTGPLPSLRAHFSLSTPHLDPAVELRRQFGAAAIKAYESEANSASGRGAGSSASASARARSMAWNTNFKVRSILVQPQDTWPPIAKTFTGMTMETIEDERRGKIGGWVHSRAYRKAELQFLQAVQSYEPNHLITLLRLYPWHIDTLQQLSDVSRHQGDLGAASDWNARALFAYERTSTTVFSSSLTSALGPPLLSFERIEDRGFWIACHRHINFMGRRGTWRTALEWVKLMLGLDPTNDHHGMILWLDFLSIKSRQHAWFLDCLQKLEAAYSAEMEAQGEYITDAKTPFDDDKESIGEGGSSRGSLDWCLGCTYAKALALRAVEKEAGDPKGEKSTAALRLAIARHPQLLPLLFDKIGLAFPSQMTSSPLFAFDSIDGDTTPLLLAHIYVSRSESLWREADASSWLLATLQEAWPKLQRHATDICRPAASEKSRMGIYRHVLVSDLPDALRQTLTGLIPRAITSNSAMLNAYDPLPPDGPQVTRYDDDYFEPVTREHAQRQQEQRQPEQGLINQFMNALRGVHGLEGWGTAMEDMDDESRQDAMAQILQMTAEARGEGQEAMPGAFDEHDQDGAEAGSGALTAFRRLLANAWGAERVDAAAAAEDDEHVP